MAPSEGRKELVTEIGTTIEHEPEVTEEGTDQRGVGGQDHKENGLVDHLLKMELVEEKRNLNSNLRQDRNLRKAYANKLFKLTCIWITLIFVMLFLQGFNRLLLSDKVLITLISSTTATFLGLFTLVIRYLFYKQG